MSRLCNHCECVGINGVRCHEAGCPKESERIFLIDDGTLDTVFACDECHEEMRFTFAETDNEAEDENAYDDFVYSSLRVCQDEHECNITPEEPWHD